MLLTPILLDVCPNALKYILRNGVDFNYSGYLKYVLFLVNEIKVIHDAKDKLPKLYFAIPFVYSKGYFYKLIVNLITVDIKQDPGVYDFYKSYLVETCEPGTIDWYHVDLTFLDLVPNLNESIGYQTTNEDRLERLNFMLSVPK